MECWNKLCDLVRLALLHRDVAIRLAVLICTLVMGAIGEVYAQDNSLTIVSQGGLPVSEGSTFESRGTVCSFISGSWRPGEMVSGRFYPIEVLISASNTALKQAIARGATAQAEQLKLNIRDLNLRLPLEQRECAAGPPTKDALPMSITSSVVENLGVLPPPYTCYGSDGTRREGTGISPPLQFDNIPPKATNLLLMLTDVTNDNFVWWQTLTVTNQSPAWQGLQAQMANSSGVIINENSLRQRGYAGPCPEAGRIGSYRFELFAISGAMKLSFGSTPKEIRSNIKPHMVAQASLDVKAIGGTPEPVSGTGSSTILGTTCGSQTLSQWSNYYADYMDLPPEEGWLSLSMYAGNIYPDRIDIVNAGNSAEVLFTSRTLFPAQPSKGFREGDFIYSIDVSFLKPLGVSRVRIEITSAWPSDKTYWEYTLSCLRDSPLKTPHRCQPQRLRQG